MPAPRGVFALLTSLLATSATVAAAMPPEPAAAIAWPASSSLVVAEVVTGGSSASDEYVEIANAGPAPVELGGCELVYVTASGATTARKASFTSPTVLKPGQHLLVANASGIYAAMADATYSGGLAADGGSLVLRRVNGGDVIDAVGWGTASNDYVEGSAAPAPPARSSIERRPGGSGGNTRDTNDNLADWLVQTSPVPQPLAPTLPPSDSPAPATETPAPTDTATATGTATPTDGATATPTPAPTDSPAPSTWPDPTVTASGPGTDPTPSSAASPGSTAVDTPTASPTGPPALETIALARAQPVGSRVDVEGVIVVAPGFVGSDGLFAIQDATGGIFVRLSASVKEIALGRTATVDGTLAAPYGQLEIRNMDSLAVASGYSDPVPSAVAISDVGETSEGSLVTVPGKITAVQSDGSRLTITLADDHGSVHLLADPASGLTSSDVVRGSAVLATGIVGQRETAAGRLDGYRIWLRSSADVVTVSAVKTATPTSGSATTKSVATGTPAPQGLATALKTRGGAVDVVAIVTATAGLLDLSGPTVVVDDGTAAAAVILPAAAAVPAVGMQVRVAGKVGRWETGPTVLASSVVALGEVEPPAPRSTAGPLGASLEWRLVRVCGRIEQYVRAGARWRVDMTVDGHEVSALGEPAAAIAIDKTSVGRLAIVTGIVRRSTSDSTVFQMLPRTAADLQLGPPPARSSAGMSGGSAVSATGAIDPGAIAGFADQAVPVSSLASYVSRTVTVAGLVTATDSGTATIDDGTGAVRLGGRAAAGEIAMLQPGDAIEATGLVIRDTSGLIIEADPASLVSLSLGPAGPADDGAPAVQGSGAVSRATARPPAIPVAIRDAPGRSSYPQAPVLAGLLIVLCFLTVGIVVIAVRHGRAREGLGFRAAGLQFGRRPPVQPQNGASEAPRAHRAGG